MVLPKAIRELARIDAGDELEVGYSGGMGETAKSQQPSLACRIRGNP